MTYRPPGKRLNGRAEGKYTRLPPTFFSCGSLAVLSGRAIVTYLAVTSQDRINPGDWAWMSPRIRDSHYGISEDTLGRGIGELAYYGLVNGQWVPRVGGQRNCALVAR